MTGCAAGGAFTFVVTKLRQDICQRLASMTYQVRHHVVSGTAGKEKHCKNDALHVPESQSAMLWQQRGSGQCRLGLRKAGRSQ